MKICFYSNCQFKGIHTYLSTKLDYDYDHVENYILIKNKRTIPVDILKSADIFIYQPIDSRHGIYSTDINIENNMMSYLSPKCKKISFPYIYNSALWILIPPSLSDSMIGNYGEAGKYINSEPIETLKIKGHSLDEVLEMYSNGKINFDFENRFNKCIKILKDKEELCDIKVSDYIINNVRSKKLFYTQNHPSSHVFIHCVNQILKILLINDLYDVNQIKKGDIIGSGCWCSTSYDINYWKFTYKEIPNDDKYIGHIKNIYNKFITN
tara:strand:- start:1137 stop:1937 length:801 start_codon:yes stop_codon:yes gene_type:complete